MNTYLPVAGAGLVLLLTAVPAAAAPAAGPRLSIAIDDGHAATAAGDTLAYTISVRNLGTAKLAGLLVTQSVPPGLAVATTRPVGVATAGTLTWRLTLPAGGVATVHSTMTVSATPAELLRLATVACAATSATGPPVVCASESDQLPAGATADAARAATTPAPASRHWYPCAAAALALLALTATALTLRRRRASGVRAGGSAGVVTRDVVDGSAWRLDREEDLREEWRCLTSLFPTGGLRGPR
jgi:uncharacterized repeat protein (TIGR01451 family)